MAKGRSMIEKLTAYIFSWKFCIHLNVIILLFHVVTMVVLGVDLASLAGITYSLGMIVMTWILDVYEKGHKKDQELISALDHLIAHMVKESKKQKSHDTDK